LTFQDGLTNIHRILVGPGIDFYEVFIIVEPNIQTSLSLEAFVYGFKNPSIYADKMAYQVA
jgi:hypothetical protein